MTNIDWKTLPYDHSGRWGKNVESIMNPNSKVTWPQLIAEFVIWFRRQLIKDYKDIKLGPKWSNQIQKQVRSLNQQASVLCNYFPHPNDEPLVKVAFKNYFRKFKPLKIGQFRKVRFTKKNNREVSNITQDEKDIVIGIKTELDRLIKQREQFKVVATKEIKKEEKVTFKTSSSGKSGSLAQILKMENEIINRPKSND